MNSFTFISFYPLLQPPGASENFEKFSQFIGNMKSFKHTRGRISIPMGRTERMLFELNIFTVNLFAYNQTSKFRDTKTLSSLRTDNVRIPPFCST